MVTRTVLKVDISCMKCKKKLLKAISGLEGIDKIELDPAKNTITVTGDADPVQIIIRTRKTGKTAEVVSIGPPAPPPKKDVAGGGGGGQKKGEEKKGGGEKKSEDHKAQGPVPVLPHTCYVCEQMGMHQPHLLYQKYVVAWAPVWAGCPRSILESVGRNGKCSIMLRCIGNSQRGLVEWLKGTSMLDLLKSFELIAARETKARLKSVRGRCGSGRVREGFAKEVTIAGSFFPRGNREVKITKKKPRPPNLGDLELNAI
ncbi:hypothetical protein H6P81_009676 [Aristolochia fimbriata]|uniref:HMA domain-containing protein n=1 Tax=Aristolochia fimbriata TaxID=158543 RepID=A0AAV7EP91_ARIFI|nr:hypothetical protein H6P81_009676 [Aristolochia fimbriata]